MRRGLLATALTLGCCATAAPAQAEPLLELGPGTQPSAVTDAAGTLHVLYRDVRVTPTALRYCRVPAGGATCAPVTLATVPQSGPRLLLRPQDGALIAVVTRPVEQPVGTFQRGDGTWVLASADGGGTWSGPTLVGVGLDGLDDAELTADGAAVDTVNDASFQRVALTGVVEQRVARLPGARLSKTRLTHLADGRPLAVSEGSGRPLAALARGADPNSAADWSRVTWRDAPVVSARALDSGPTGTWLLTRDSAPRGDSFRVRLWRWGGRGFALARRAGALNLPLTQPIGAGASDSDAVLDVDLAGRLHAAWTLPEHRCGGQHCIVYRRTDRRGFWPAIVYPAGPHAVDRPVDSTLAPNSGGSGWLVWGTLDHRVRAVALVTPPRGSFVGSRRIGRRRVSIPDFYGCVPPGGTFVHRLRVDGRPSTQILSVRFFFDAGEPSRTDSRAPFRQVFRLAFAPGTRHVASAIVRYRLPGSRNVRSVRLGRTFVMC